MTPSQLSNHLVTVHKNLSNFHPVITTCTKNTPRSYEALKKLSSEGEISLLKQSTSLTSVAGMLSENVTFDL